jgi:serine phosphatase RsbU (regulator of sigma subunit)
MAVKDVKDYYYKMVAQYLEMKNDLADFEHALKEGFITEDQLQAAIEEVNALQVNYDRLTYIMYLLELPNRRSKHARHNKANKKVLNALKERDADIEAVVAENKSALDLFRKELKRLEKENK